MGDSIMNIMLSELTDKERLDYTRAAINGEIVMKPGDKTHLEAWVRMRDEKRLGKQKKLFEVL